MATKKKMLQAAAGNAGGDPLDITDVFSTYLYEGTGSALTINNGIDLAGEGGLTWIRNRGPNAANHAFYDTERGVRKYVISNNSSAQDTASAGSGLTAFNSNGFTLGGSWLDENNNGQDAASWTFRKAPKFFDVVQWDGDGVYGRNIPHSLDGPVGSIFIKCTTSAFDWRVWHRSLAQGADNGQMLVLNSTAAQVAAQVYAASSTNFTLTNNATVNGSGRSYVAYLFAHNDGDGEFGPDVDQDIIKCGSYTGNGNYLNGKYVDVGFEPQWILQKAVSTTGPWLLLDTMRGWDVNTGNKPRLLANATNNEANADSGFALTGNSGFTIYDTSSKINGNGQTYIYMAIRRGPLAPPESATEVFDVVTRTDSGSNTQHTVGFAPDVVLDMSRPSYSYNFVYDRLRGGKKYLAPNATSAEGTFDYITFDDETGKFTTKSQTSGGITFVDYVWKRAPNFFDVATYSGSNSTQNISHNLGVQPEMIWIKNRSYSGTNWVALFTSLGARKYLLPNTADPEITLPLYNGTDFFANTLPTSSVFTVGGGSAGGGYDDVGSVDSNYIAYLFASLPGISKVGSFTGNGASQDIDCGFTSGARFVLLKRTDSSGTWFILDTARGIVAGNDAILRPNTTTAEDNNYDIIDPLSSGFTINYVSAYNMNSSGAEYIFYAIA